MRCSTSRTATLSVRFRALPVSLVRLPRRVKLPIRTCCAAIVLFTIGTFMLYFGIPEWWKGGAARERGTAMIVLGSLTFIPGSYATVQLYGAYRQWPGYRFDAIPSYDE